MAKKNSSKMNISGAFKETEKAISGIVAVGFVALIGLILLGSVLNAVTSGSITLPTGFNSVLNAQDTTMSGYFTTGLTVVGTIVGLVVVVVLIKLFRGGKGGDMA